MFDKQTDLFVVIYGSKLTIYILFTTEKFVVFFFHSDGEEWYLLTYLTWVNMRVCDIVFILNVNACEHYYVTGFSTSRFVRRLCNFQIERHKHFEQIVQDFVVW